jgi:hypothetical protein
MHAYYSGFNAVSLSPTPTVPHLTCPQARQK